MFFTGICLNGYYFVFNGGFHAEILLERLVNLEVGNGKALRPQTGDFFVQREDPERLLGRLRIKRLEVEGENAKPEKRRTSNRQRKHAASTFGLQYGTTDRGSSAAVLPSGLAIPSAPSPLCREFGRTPAESLRRGPSAKPFPLRNRCLQHRVKEMLCRQG